VPNSPRVMEHLGITLDVAPSTLEGSLPEDQRCSAALGASPQLTQAPTSRPPEDETSANPTPVFFLREEHYVVLGSVGTDRRSLKPMRIVMDTGSGPSVIRASALPPHWRRYVESVGEDPGLADANGNPLRVTERVRLLVRLGNKWFTVLFYITPNLAVPVILGTGVMNRHVKSIHCWSQRIELLRGGSIAILSTKQGRVDRGTGNIPRDVVEGGLHDPEHPRRPPPGDIAAHTVRLARGITIPAQAQAAVAVTCAGGGLSYLEPKGALYERHRVRMTNGVAEILPNTPFQVIVANFGARKCSLPKGTVLGYAQRAPLAIIVPNPHEGDDVEEGTYIPSDQPITEASTSVRQGACFNASVDIIAPGAGTIFPTDGDKPSALGGEPPPLQEQRFPGVAGTSTLEEGAPRAAFSRGAGASSTQMPSDESEDTKSKEQSIAVDWREAIDLAHLDDPSLRKQVMDMLEKHESMWSGALGDIKITEHRIEVHPESKPVRRRQLATEEISKMLRDGIVEPATGEWASPIVLVPKKDGQLRFCVDYRKLNEITVSDAYPLPRMDDCIDSLGNATIFTTLDCNSGYWQIPVAECDKDKTAFTSHMGTFRFNRLPFGLKNAPATFQRALDMILSGVRWQSCLIYLDDVIIFSRSREDHLQQVDQVLGLLRAAGVTLKLAKCHFFKDRVDYLGHVILPGRLSVAAKATEAIAQAVFPETPTQMRSFLGSCNVYRRFAKDFAHIARPLNVMLTKDRLPDFGKVPPTEKESEAFNALKALLVNPPVLVLPKIGKPYMVDTDASAYQVGCSLLQEQEDGDWHPVGYWSRALNKAEQGYSPTERECLAVVWAVTTLRPYLERTKFVVRSDHNALRWLMNVTDLSGRLVRWRLRLSEFDYTIAYRPGRVHQVPDALSRIRTEGLDTEPLDDAIPCLLFGQGRTVDVEILEEDLDEPDFFDPYRARTPEGVPFSKGESVLLTDSNQPNIQHQAIELDEWLVEQKRDEFCLNVLARQSASADSAFFEDEDGLLRRRSNLDGANQLVVPASLRQRLLAMCHRNIAAGHPGQTRMYETMRVSYYWPAMSSDIAHTVQRCASCAKNRLRFSKRSTTLKLFPAKHPLEDVGVVSLLEADTSHPVKDHQCVQCGRGLRYALGL